MSRINISTVSSFLLLSFLIGVAWPAEPTAKDFANYYSPLFGKWQTTAEFDGEVTHGSTTWKLAENGTCILVDWNDGGGTAVQSVQGFGATTGTWQMARFDGEGRFTMGKLDHKNVKPGKTLTPGLIGHWEDTSEEGGQKITRRSDVHCIQLTAKRVVLEWSDRTENDKQLPKLRVTMDRVADKKPAEASKNAWTQKKDPGPDYEQLKQLEWLIGEWEGTITVPAGFPEIYPDGATVVSKQSCYWMQGRNYIGFEFRDFVDGKLAHEGFEMVGVDPKSKQPIHWIFSVAGGYGKGKWSRDGEAWKLDWNATLPNGAEYRGVSDHIPVNRDTYKWQIRDATRNGKKVPDYPVVEFKRVETKADTVKSRGTQAVAPYYKKHQILEHLSVGSWNVKGSSNGVDISGKLTGRWSPDKSCVMFSGHFGPPAGGDVINVNGIIGWDEASGKIKEQIFASDGTCATAHFEVQDRVLVGQRSGVNPQGKPYTQKLRFTLGKDKWTGAPVEDKGPNGEVLASHGEWVFTRVK
jgi:hypothetical protein